MICKKWTTYIKIERYSVNHSMLIQSAGYFSECSIDNRLQGDGISRGNCGDGLVCLIDGDCASKWIKHK